MFTIYEGSSLSEGDLKELFKSFGKDFIELPVFYNNPGCLRFELSTGGTHVDMALEAHSKAMALVNRLFEGETSIALLLWTWGRSRLHAGLFIKRFFVSQGLGLPKLKFLSQSQQMDDNCDEDYNRFETLVSFPLTAMRTLLWSQVTRDFGIYSVPAPNMYFMSLSGGKLFWAYDDRGADLLAKDRDLALHFKNSFDEWLLNYDRTEMDKYYSGSSAT